MGPTKISGELASVDDVHVSRKHEALADKHAATIRDYFDNDQNCRSREGHRDVVMIGLVLPGRCRTIVRYVNQLLARMVKGSSPDTPGSER